MSDQVLSAAERTKLAACEQTIEIGLRGQFETGAALKEISSARLYRETHATFEDYVHGRFVVADLHDYRMLLDAAESVHYEVGVPLVWITDSERSVTDWSAKLSTRYILHLRRGNAELVTQIGNAISCAEEDLKRHPDQRPLALIRTLLEIATNPGDRILDLNAVAATANIACRQLGRGCIGITDERESYEAGIGRLQEANGFDNDEASN